MKEKTKFKLSHCLLIITNERREKTKVTNYTNVFYLKSIYIYACKNKTNEHRETKFLLSEHVCATYRKSSMGGGLI